MGGLSIWFVEEPFAYEARVLITTFAAGMTVLAAVAAVQVYRRGSRLAWMSLWAYPAFFVSHVVMLETYVVDLTLAAVASAALLLLWQDMVPQAKPAARTPSGTS